MWYFWNVKITIRLNPCEFAKMITRELIIETATDLFVQHGVKTVTIDKIVKEMHTSKRTIYNHFEDKTALLKACLEEYHDKVKQENEEIIKSSANVIESFGRLHHKILSRGYQVNSNFFSDIINYYPRLLHRSYRSTGNFAHQQLVFLAQWGIEDGIFEKDMDVEVVGKTVLGLMKLLNNTRQFPVAEFSKERLTFGILVPYMRGLCTSKGIKLLEKQEELFRVSI
jgi:AcrR family transcriptional regulator